MSTSELATFFRQMREEILTRWRNEVRRLPGAEGLDQPTLTDHIPDLLEEIIADLAQAREGPIGAEHVLGSPPVHGVQRVADGFDIAEVVTEYHLLREALLDTAAAHDMPVARAARKLMMRRIDEAAALAVQSFAAQRALELKQRQEEHLSFVTHDLRTPLNAISLVAQELEETYPEAQRADALESFATLHRNVRRLDAVVRRVLQDSRQVEEGTAFKPVPRQFDLWPLVQRLLADLRPLAEKEHVTVRNTVRRGFEIFADAGLTSQVLQNLLSNAFRFAPGGEVTIGAEPCDDADWIECSVRDNGSGIEPERLERVFDKRETDPDPAKKSTGLGLAIVKQIAEAHGGKVSVTSAPGEGATFRFTLRARE